MIVKSHSALRHLSDWSNTFRSSLFLRFWGSWRGGHRPMFFLLFLILFGSFILIVYFYNFRFLLRINRRFRKHRRLHMRRILIGRLSLCFLRQTRLFLQINAHLLSSGSNCLIFFGFSTFLFYFVVIWILVIVFVSLFRSASTVTHVVICLILSCLVPKWFLSLRVLFFGINF